MQQSDYIAIPDTVSNHFSAAVGVEQQMSRVAQYHLRRFYRDILRQYRQEAQYERARLMRQKPLDYLAVRAMDRELDDVSRQLGDMERDAIFTE